ncbi:MAG: TetR/AcrR family transcriptional regulator [Crocinitomicaceae bacterium]|nr:TetR/AcrR family transcriptional regulator [Crocinitomicaceae bacterium]
MQDLQSNIAIKINPNVYKKDPLSSDLGAKILRQGCNLIDDLGFEKFTFKKLANHIESTEASVYRYFENKHNLLAYLTMWYWSWAEYKVLLNTLNIDCPKIRLQRAMKCLTEEVIEDAEFSQVNEVKLNQIVIRESSKVYLCKTVDSDNESGFFHVYKSLVQRIANIILEIRPTFKYPHMLISTVIEGARHQRFFSDHLPRLTDVIVGEDAVTDFYLQLVQRELGIED